MKLFIDADGCPVVDIALKIANRHNVAATLVCDWAHEFKRTDAEVLVVPKGADSADFRLVNLIHAEDIVITQDYGLAAMCLARKATVLNQNGLIYHDGNIDSLLMARHTARKIRNAGGRTKGPAKRTASQDTAFATALESLMVSAEK